MEVDCVVCGSRVEVEVDIAGDVWAAVRVKERVESLAKALEADIGIRGVDGAIDSVQAGRDVARRLAAVRGTIWDAVRLIEGAAATSTEIVRALYRSNTCEACRDAMAGE